MKLQDILNTMKMRLQGYSPDNIETNRQVAAGLLPPEMAEIYPQPFTVDAQNQMSIGNDQTGAAVGYGNGELAGGLGLAGYALRAGLSAPTKSLGFEFSTPDGSGDFNGYASADPERMAQVRRNTPGRRQVGPFWMGPQRY